MKFFRAIAFFLIGFVIIYFFLPETIYELWGRIFNVDILIRSLDDLSTSKGKMILAFGFPLVLIYFSQISWFRSLPVRELGGFMLIFVGLFIGVLVNILLFRNAKPVGGWEISVRECLKMSTILPLQALLLLLFQVLFAVSPSKQNGNVAS